MTCSIVGDGFNPSTKPIEQKAQSSKPSRRRRRSRFSRLQLNQEAPLVEAESKRSEVDRLNGSKRASHNQARRTDKAQSVKRDQVKVIEQSIKGEESKGERHRHLATQTQRRDQGLSSVQSSLCYLYFSGLSSHELRLAFTFSTFVTSSRNLINASVRPIFSIVYFI